MLCGKKNYKELEIYHLAHSLCLSIYALIDGFPDVENRNLKDQLRRAATSLPLNIAEGSGSISYRKFLSYCCFDYASCRELEAGFALAKDLGYISNEQFSSVMELLDKFSRYLFNYMKYLDSKVSERRSSFSNFVFEKGLSNKEL